MQILTAFALLIPAFSLLSKPPLEILFLRVYNAPLPNITVLPKLRCQV